MPSQERVKITETPIPQAATLPEVQIRVQQIYEEGLPGFIIKSSGLVDLRTNSQEQIVDALIEILTELDKEEDPVPYKNLGSSPLRESSPILGVAHHDYSNLDDSFSQLRVHRTVYGSGKVILANSGRLDQATAPIELRTMFTDRPDTLRRGLSEVVDPDIVNPNVYTGYLQPGDTVIFPTIISSEETHSNAGPVWHQFDTDVAPRNANLIVIGKD